MKTIAINLLIVCAALLLMCSATACLDPGDPDAETIITSAQCVEQSSPVVNVLRYDCTVETACAADVNIAFGEEGEQLSRQTKTSTGMIHSFTLYNLKTGTDYKWEARTGDESVSGEFTTRSLPDDLANVQTEIVQPCQNCNTDYVLLIMGCGTDAGSDYLTVFDVQGNIVWYDNLSYIIGEESPSIDTMSITDNNTIVAMANREWIVELDFTGNVLMTLQRNEVEEFENYVHHDVLRHGKKYLGDYGT